MSARLPKFVNVNNARYARPLLHILHMHFKLGFGAFVSFLHVVSRGSSSETNRAGDIWRRSSFQQLSTAWVKHVVVPGHVLPWLSCSAGSPTATPTKILTQVGRANAQVQTAELSHAPAQLHNCHCNKLELGRTRRHDEWMFGSISRRSVQVDNSHLDSARSARHEHQPQLS